MGLSIYHEAGKYVTELGATTNGVESFWSMLKRGIVGTYHQVSRKHLQAYVDEFAGRHNLRPDGRGRARDGREAAQLSAAHRVAPRRAWRNEQNPCKSHAATLAGR